MYSKDPAVICCFDFHVADSFVSFGHKKKDEMFSFILDLVLNLSTCCVSGFLQIHVNVAILCNKARVPLSYVHTHTCLTHTHSDTHTKGLLWLRGQRNWPVYTWVEFKPSFPTLSVHSQLYIFAQSVPWLNKHKLCCQRKEESTRLELPVWFKLSFQNHFC